MPQPQLAKWPKAAEKKATEELAALLAGVLKAKKLDIGQLSSKIATLMASAELAGLDPYYQRKDLIQDALKELRQEILREKGTLHLPAFCKAVQEGLLSLIFIAKLNKVQLAETKRQEAELASAAEAYSLARGSKRKPPMSDSSSMGGSESNVALAFASSDESRGRKRVRFAESVLESVP